MNTLQMSTPQTGRLRRPRACSGCCHHHWPSAVHANVLLVSRGARQHSCSRLKASSAQEPQKDALSAESRLDFLLGSVDEQQQATGVQSKPPDQVKALVAPGWDKAFKMAGIFKLGSKVEPMKVPPVWSFIFYYWNIVIYVAVMYLDATEGPGAGAEFSYQLINDHLAVTVGGEAYRLLSCPFIHVSPWSMFVTILALGTIGAELEGHLGYWPFFGFCTLLVTSSSLLDVVVDQDPVTHGSLPLLAGLVGGLLVAYAKDTLLEEKVQKVTTVGPTAGSTAASDGPEASETTSTGRPLSQASRGSLDDVEDEVEVEFFEGLYKTKVQTTPLLKAAATISTGALAAIEALYDLQQEDDINTTWAGVLGGLGVGILLAVLLLPRFSVMRVALRTALSAAPTSAFAGRAKPTLTPEQLSRDVYWLYDKTSWQQKLAVVVGGTMACTLVLAQVSTAL